MMSSQKLFAFAFAFALIIVAGCTGQPSTQPSGSAAQAEVDYLQKAESLRSGFFYTGECNDKCEAVIDAFEDAIEYAKNPGARAQAQQKLAEFLFWLKKYNDAFDYAEQLAGSADSSHRCAGYNIMGNIMSQLKKYEDALRYFYSAREICADKSSAERSICYTYADLGRQDDADDFCKQYFS